MDQATTNKLDTDTPKAKKLKQLQIKSFLRVSPVDKLGSPDAGPSGSGMYLLGCIFHFCDYGGDKWREIIHKFGGIVSDTYHSRITHLMCKSQESAVSQQALREGKRLVTKYWLEDIVSEQANLPPWKALHFPLPAK